MQCWLRNCAMREHVAPSDLVNVDTEDKGGVERSGSHRWRLVCVARGGKLSRHNNHNKRAAAKPNEIETVEYRTM